MNFYMGSWFYIFKKHNFFGKPENMPLLKFIIIITVIVTFSLGNAFAKEFEGIVEYRNSVLDENGEAQSTLEKKVGSKRMYYIKGGNYKSVSNGALFKYQIYLFDENKIYTKKIGTDKYDIVDAADNEFPVLDYSISFNQETILGFKCDLITILTENGVYKYYYSRAHKINPDNYIKHNNGNWRFYVSRTSALPLKMVFEINTKRFFVAYKTIYESVAVNIIERPLSLEEFEIKK